MVSFFDLRFARTALDAEDLCWNVRNTVFAETFPKADHTGLFLPQDHSLKYHLAVISICQI